MADLTKSLLDAISIIANKTAEEISSDKTIKAIVKKNISTSEGKYLVEYNNGSFYAYIQSGSKDLYKIGEQVYILVPEGDMSQKKFIIGKVKEGVEYQPKNPHDPVLNNYIIVGNNAIIENTYKTENNISVKRMQPLALDPYKVNDFYYCYLHNKDIVNNQLNYDSIEYPTISVDEETFSNSAKQSEALLLRAKFKASLDTEKIGNYGIIVNVAFADDTNPQIAKDGTVTYPPKMVAYVLDISKMTGNPTKFYDYTSQYMMAPFDGKKYLYIDSIVAFSESFVEQTTSSNSGNYIFIDDIELIALKEAVTVNGDYKLKLSTPRGNTIKVGEKTALKIIGSTTYMNQDITEDTIFYWGVKDPSITSISDNYNAKLGSGYRYLENEKGNELILTRSELTAAENIFVCVAVYESNIVLKTSLSMYNNNNKLNITIESDQGVKFQNNEGNPVLTCLINGKEADYQEGYPDESFAFVWTKEDLELGTVILDETIEQLKANEEKELAQYRENGISDAGRTYLEIIQYYSTRIAQIGDTEYLNGVRGPKIKCKTKNINTYVTYSCSVYRAGIYIGYGSITLENSRQIVNTNYYIAIENGTQVFQYDERGIAPNSEKQKDPIEVKDLTAIFYSPQRTVVTPKQVRWIIPSEKTLIDIPSLGLQTDNETGERYYSGDFFPLKIKEVYDNNCVNNQLTVVITHEDGTEYRQETNLLFTKVGNIGTNGTGVVVKINELGTKLEGECLALIKEGEEEEERVFYNNGQSQELPILNSELYLNNDKIFGHTTKWSIAGNSGVKSRFYQIVDNDGNNDCIVRYSDDENNSKLLDTRIIKAQTSFGGKYCNGFYGIPMIEYFNDYNYDNYKIKIMEDGTLRNVLYDSNGMNPSYNTNQGVHIELENWNNFDHLEWIVESGPKQQGIYREPNILLSMHPKSKVGAKRLFVAGNSLDLILAAKNLETSNYEGNIGYYINNFLVDVKEIGLDTILTTTEKINKLSDRIKKFLQSAPNKNNADITKVYMTYKNLFKQIQNEYNNCEEENEKNLKVYNEIQEIWSSEWPSAITESHLELSTVNTVQTLNDKYKLAYDNRSNDTDDLIINYIKEGTFRRDSENNPRGFDEGFLRLLEGLDNNISQNNEINLSSFHPILVEYTKILVEYLNILIQQTKSCVNNNILGNDVKAPYLSICQEWEESIGQDIYKILDASNENIANVYDYVRGLYEYYQKLFKDVRKYQVAKDSETLKIWNSSLKDEPLNSALKQIYIIPNDTFNGIYMNNNVVGIIYTKNNANVETIAAKIYIPIIMTLNTYELAALNGWDGTSIKIGDEYITTPQIGAGIKDEKTNTFTGMVMGAVNNLSIDNENNTPKFKKVDRIGLLGYTNGKQSMFIDSKTGRAYFGLSEDDVESESGTNEGRIELIPGGVSKIGNWKIGNRFLYNIINGSYEKRIDKDVRSKTLTSQQKNMIPHNKYGIILSSDQPYIHIKGKIYENEELKNVDFSDEYNEINPEDSLELRLDPNNKSLFSIVQHTAGFGDEENTNLFAGYATEDPVENIITISKYKSNENITQNDCQLEYYLYGLVKDLNGNPKSYFVQQQSPGLQKQGLNIPVGEDFSWYNTLFEIYDNETYLKNAITEANIKRAFKIDDKTGVISYDPNFLIWKNGAETNGWSTRTEKFSSDFPFQVEFNLNKKIESPIESIIKIGKFQNNTIHFIYSLNFNCSLIHNCKRIELDDTDIINIQFYITDTENGDINSAILESDNIKFYKNEEWNNLNIQLSSHNDLCLEPENSNKIYYLKAKIYIDKYTINSSYFYEVKPSFINYETPPDPTYGTLEISELEETNGRVNFTTSNGIKNNISGYYEIYTEGAERRIKITVTGNKKYDFIIWRKNESSIFGGGRTSSDSYAKYFDSNFKTSDEALDYFVLSIPIPLENHWCINFYQEDFCINEQTSYEVENISDSSDDQTITQTNTVTIVKYKLETVLMENKYRYEIDWPSSNSYNNAIVFWGFELSKFNVGNILGLIPEDTTLLCIEGDARTTGVQGVAYSKTYWDNDIQKVIFYDRYYTLVNTPGQEKSSYGYVDIDIDKNLYYKHIKTLVKQKVNTWFTAEDTNSFPEISYFGQRSQGGIWPKISIITAEKIFENAIYWKEFIRVGLDENGRLFSAGIQDKRTYSRTGRLNVFGSIPQVYGQEIRTNINNNYVPIIKIFTQNIGSNGLKTTYITQGATENGNISIRTAATNNINDNNVNSNNSYVELAASKSSRNKEKTIPEKTACVQVKHNNIIMQIGNDSEGIANINLKTEGNNSNFKRNISIKADSTLISSKNDETIFEINDSHTNIKSPKVIFSSPSRISSLSDGYYKISGCQINNGDKISSKIQLESEKANIELTPSSIVLALNTNSSPNITMEKKSNSSSFNFNLSNNINMYFKEEKEEQGTSTNSIISLQNNNWEIDIIKENNSKSMLLGYVYSRNNNKIITKGIEISDKVYIKGNSDGFSVEGMSTFQKKANFQKSIYTLEDIHVGYMKDTDTSSNFESFDNRAIYLYNGDNDGSYVKLLADNLKQLFDWYNKYRWAIGWNGNTVWLNTVDPQSQEGSYDSSRNAYVWDLNTFHNYTGKIKY